MCILAIVNDQDMHIKITEALIREVFAKKKVEYNSTHAKLSLPIINRIYKKMLNGIKFENIRVCDNMVIDGHHRYVASIIADKDLFIDNYPKTSATLKYEWLAVEFVDEEWDTEDKIQYLNELDAKYNDVSLEKIKNIIK